MSMIFSLAHKTQWQIIGRSPLSPPLIQTNPLSVMVLETDHQPRCPRHLVVLLRPFNPWQATSPNQSWTHPAVLPHLEQLTLPPQEQTALYTPLKLTTPLTVLRLPHKASQVTFRPHPPHTMMSSLLRIFRPWNMLLQPALNLHLYQRCQRWSRQ